MREGTTDRLVAFIQDEIVLDRSAVGAETDLLLSGVVDSLGVIRITQWLEDELAITVDPGDVTLENFRTITAMTHYVERRVAI